MHEMALTQSVVRVLAEQAGKHGFARVRTVWLEIGALSHVDPQAVTFCFQAVARGTVAEGASVEVVRVPGQAWCMTCERSVAIGQRFDACPDCGGHGLRVTAGEEMRITQVEVD